MQKESEGEELIHLGYPDSAFGGGYYIAQVRPGVGVCAAKLINQYFVQFFPWGGPDDEWKTGEAEFEKPLKGHTRYYRFIMDNTHSPALLKRLLYLSTKTPSDLFTIKCLIEDGVTTIETNGDLDAIHKANAAYAAAGKAVE